MSFQPQNKPIQSFGQLQDTFVFRLRNFIQGEQFTIVEDSPRHKIPRTAQRNGGKGQYTVCLITISFNGTNADLELYDNELSQIAALCPKGTQNFKGATFAFDGRRWQYICGDNPIPRDPRQPDLNPPTQQQPIDQRDLYLNKLVEAMKTASLYDELTESRVSKIADKISPNGSDALISYGKTKGAFCESQGVFRVM